MSQVELRTRLQEALGSAFTLERELPRGGMSRVFAATENAFGRQVVIKVLSPELAATISAERFKREITLAARLQHPHIVPLISAGEAGGSLYYTMPLVDGELLRERMSRERQLPFDDIARILEEVCAALAFAHEQGVVHRDIKPENIMFFHDQAVVMDFGIARALTASEDPAMSRITKAGMALGTPTYVAPEQAAGDARLDHRADLYALGVVAYEMLTGHPPFAGRNPQAVFAAHASQAPPPIEQRRPDTPAPLARIVMKCLAKLPADRPQSAREIGRVVSAMSQSRPSESRGAPWSRAPGWVPWAVAATMTVIAVVATVFAMRCPC
jgi:eukaryotic-like serine/threonine-protein kinase